MNNNTLETIPMRKKKNAWSVFLLLATLLLTLSSCSESNEEVEEFPNWQATNTAYFESLYQQTKQKIAAGDTEWKLIKAYSKDQTTEGKAVDYIIVHVLNEGTGSGNPLFSDTVRVDYRGRLLPSTSYSQGYVFDQSWRGDYNLATMMPAKLAVGLTTDGFATALMKMNIGDRWEIYIPQELGYGQVATTSIPAYSTLIFDVTLRAYYHPGTKVPDWKAKPHLLTEE